MALDRRVARCRRSELPRRLTATWCRQSGDGGRGQRGHGPSARGTELAEGRAEEILQRRRTLDLRIKPGHSGGESALD
eukprot:CAMPEP_0204181976 /NCGR_PEP_ID=MMETSP0361-20130328/52385_1 /ASSEMBLY_ACC=CAM_ASM_000343 /TAXON_ID=268821 /ORGANISM="Scrippsiella Hangoei, Strain SHTV-5" /LENGTH=77 /DNA_ID=CAMNT_0051141653 /DNA_START=73 /DNA_END=306 /DNA_ORIENTATION=+